MDVIGMYTGPPLIVHDNDDCRGRNCCIHWPSPHPLADRPLNWRGPWIGMERICEHGIGHPDPDDLAYRKSIGAPLHTVHGCDGCCCPIDFDRTGEEKHL